MYGIYKHEDTLVGICHTKIGARRACKHFARFFAQENNNASCRVSYRYVDSYWKIRIGCLLLAQVRRIEKQKLRRLEYEERLATFEREAQAKKVASLY